MSTFSDEYKNGVIQMIITAAVWLTGISEYLQHGLLVDFDGLISIPPEGDEPYARLFQLEDKIQQHQRVAQRIDKRFQHLMALYCESFNGGEKSGEFSFAGETYEFWFEDGKYNLITKGEPKIIEFRN